MPVIPASEARTYELHGVQFRSLASPTNGSTETSVWQTEIPVGTPAAPHQLTREEIIVVLSGRALARFDDDVTEAATGDTIVVPPDTTFALENVGDEPLRVLACFPVGGQGRLDGETITLPWMA